MSGAEERLRFQAQLLEAVDQAVVAADLDGTVIYWNRAAEALFGWSAAEAQGRPVVELTLAEVAQREVEELRQRLQEGRSWSGEVAVRRRGGSAAAVLTSVSPIRDEVGNVIGHVAVSSDISRRQRMEQELRLSKERFAKVFQASPTAIDISTVAEGRVIDVNDRFCELFGYSREEVLGRTAAELRLWGDLQERERMVGRLRAEGAVRQAENRLRRKDGRIVDVLVSVEVGEYADVGEPVLMALLMDITEAKRAEAALRQSEEIHRLLVELSPAAIFVHRHDMLLYVNPAAACMMGEQDPSRLVGRSFYQLSHADQEKRLRRLFRSLADAGLRRAVESWKRRDGTVRHLDLMSAPISFRNGPARMVIAHDVTEQVRAQEEVRASREELRRLTAHLQTVREDEQARIAREIHDQLGQTLTGLKLSAAWLGQELRELDGAAPSEEHLERVDLIGELVEESLRSVQRLALDLRPPLLDDLGLEAAIEWQVEEFRRRTGLECEMCSGLADSRLDQAHATALFRILQEALTNVARHARASRVDIELREEGGEVVLEVRDDGIGIPEEKLRGASPSLGLVGMRERALACGGQIEICGAAGEGTRVTARCPTPERRPSLPDG